LFLAAFGLELCSALDLLLSCDTCVWISCLTVLLLCSFCNSYWSSSFWFDSLLLCFNFVLFGHCSCFSTWSFVFLVWLFVALLGLCSLLGLSSLTLFLLQLYWSFVFLVCCFAWTYSSLDIVLASSATLIDWSASCLSGLAVWLTCK